MRGELAREGMQRPPASPFCSSCLQDRSTAFCRDCTIPSKSGRSWYCSCCSPMDVRAPGVGVKEATRNVGMRVLYSCGTACEAASISRHIAAVDDARGVLCVAYLLNFVHCVGQLLLPIILHRFLRHLGSQLGTLLSLRRSRVQCESNGRVRRVQILLGKSRSGILRRPCYLPSMPLARCGEVSAVDTLYFAVGHAHELPSHVVSVILLPSSP